MKQIIDMGGFKNETIEVRFGEDVYQIPLDPPIEAYRQILSLQGAKLKTEEDWDKYKELVTTIICKANPDVNKKEFFKSLTKQSAIRFMNPYAEFLFKRSDSKNVQNPPSESKEEKK